MFKRKKLMDWWEELGGWLGCSSLSSWLQEWLGGWLGGLMFEWVVLCISFHTDIHLTLIFFVCFFPSLFVSLSSSSWLITSQKKATTIYRYLPLSVVGSLEDGGRVAATLGQISTGFLFFIKPQTLKIFRCMHQNKTCFQFLRIFLVERW